MNSHTSIDSLLSGKIVEGSRMEFKRGWNATAIMRTICAFANDFENEGSGYILVGIDEKEGIPLRPIIGFDPRTLEKVEKELVGYCNQMQPSYYPKLSLEKIDNKYVLII
ncbi:helix-turn-helix domain-containing protein [Aquirufa antheringensis]|uniref:AlbA family DNA-binding domain-containing protein n=1 Tax=Aquirufa antheringensis TaxID=2516559 RepID=UPI00208F13C4|nr:ATP-binding protein [Aquirufa antheringensis]USQ03643.1 ATP-binding protein [Aquirufa antheringensis]